MSSEFIKMHGFKFVPRYKEWSDGSRSLYAFSVKQYPFILLRLDGLDYTRQRARQVLAKAAYQHSLLTSERVLSAIRELDILKGRGAHSFAAADRTVEEIRKRFSLPINVKMNGVVSFDTTNSHTWLERRYLVRLLMREGFFYLGWGSEPSESPILISHADLADYVLSLYQDEVCAGEGSLSTTTEPIHAKYRG